MISSIFIYSSKFIFQLLPSGIQYEAQRLEEGVLIDTFSPEREDFLK